MPRFLALYTDDAAILDYGIRYSNWVFLFGAMASLSIGFEKVYQAVGRMKTTMISLTAGCVTNIVLDPLFIFGLGPIPAFGIEGAAVATGLGQTVSFVIYVAVYFRKSLGVRVSWRLFKPEARMTARLYSIGIPAVLNLALPSLLTSALNAILTGFSETYVLVLGLYYKLQTFLYMPANGIVQGMRPLVGYNYGAGEYGRVRQLYKLVLILSAAIMAAGTVIFLTVPGGLIGIFAEDSAAITAGERALRIISIGFIISSVSVTSSGALEGLGKGGASLVISMCRNVVIIIPLAWILSKLIGVDGVWHAFWITEALSAGVSLFVYRRSLRTGPRI